MALDEEYQKAKERVTKAADKLNSALVALMFSKPTSESIKIVVEEDDWDTPTRPPVIHISLVENREERLS